MDNFSPANKHGHKEEALKQLPDATRNFEERKSSLLRDSLGNPSVLLGEPGVVPAQRTSIQASPNRTVRPDEKYIWFLSLEGVDQQNNPPARPLARRRSPRHIIASHHSNSSIPVWTSQIQKVVELEAITISYQECIDMVSIQPNLGRGVPANKIEGRGTGAIVNYQYVLSVQVPSRMKP